MEVDHNSTVAEVSTDDLLAYLESDGRLPISIGDVLNGITNIEFRYSTSVERRHNADYALVLNSRSIKKLVEMDAVRYSLGGDEYTLVLKMDRDRGSERKHLKKAFHAHEDETFHGKDPRRVWREYESQ